MRNRLLSLEPDQRQHKYTTRARTLYIKRITQPMDLEPRTYKSVRTMSEELLISDHAIRDFIVSGEDSMYIRSKRTNVLYLLYKPVKDLAATAILAVAKDTDAPQMQTFTSVYQIAKRFDLANETVYKLKRETPVGEKTTRTVKDEFGNRYYLIFNKE